MAYFNFFYDEPWSLLVLLVGVTAIVRLRGRRRLQAITVVGLTAIGVVLLDQ